MIVLQSVCIFLKFLLELFQSFLASKSDIEAFEIRANYPVFPEQTKRIEHEGIFYILRSDFWYQICWENGDLSLELYEGLEEVLEWNKPDVSDTHLISEKLGNNSEPYFNPVSRTLTYNDLQQRLLLDQCCCSISDDHSRQMNVDIMCNLRDQVNNLRQAQQNAIIINSLNTPTPVYKTIPIFTMPVNDHTFNGF